VRQATGNEAQDKHVRVLCQRVQRLLRMALSDWYGYLSRESLGSNEWRHGVPWWVKRVPDRFDLDWAMNDLYEYINTPGMLVSLYTSVDETVLSMNRDKEILHSPPKIDLLHEALKELCDVLGV
jgi:hypothetical protein